VSDVRESADKSIGEQRPARKQFAMVLDWRSFLIAGILILIMTSRLWIPPLLNIDFDAIWADKRYRLTIKPIDELSRSRASSLAYRVAVVNRSKVVSDDEVKALAVTLQSQVHNDLAPAWGVDAEVTFVPKSGSPATDSWTVEVLDDSDAIGALAYHDLNSEGLPRAKVFAGSAKKSGALWSVSASHEILELLINPRANLVAISGGEESPTKTPRFYAYEVCDPVNDEDYAYSINGVFVSDFVYPAWFNDSSKPGTQFDHKKHVTKPFEVLERGHATYFEHDVWKQILP
jgi:hypothetical protein